MSPLSALLLRGRTFWSNSDVHTHALRYRITDAVAISAAAGVNSLLHLCVPAGPYASEVIGTACCIPWAAMPFLRGAAFAAVSKCSIDHMGSHEHDVTRDTSTLVPVQSVTPSIVTTPGHISVAITKAFSEQATAVWLRRREGPIKVRSCQIPTGRALADQLSSQEKRPVHRSALVGCHQCTCVRMIERSAFVMLCA